MSLIQVLSHYFFTSQVYFSIFLKHLLLFSHTFFTSLPIVPWIHFFHEFFNFVSTIFKKIHPFSSTTFHDFVHSSHFLHKFISLNRICKNSFSLFSQIGYTFHDVSQFLHKITLVFFYQFFHKFITFFLLPLLSTSSLFFSHEFLALFNDFFFTKLGGSNEFFTNLSFFFLNELLFSPHFFLNPSLFLFVEFYCFLWIHKFSIFKFLNSSWIFFPPHGFFSYEFFWDLSFFSH